jgi:uncharacterized protein YciI
VTAESLFWEFLEEATRARDPARVAALADEIETLLSDPTRCTWCGTQVRQYDREHDEAEAVHLSVGDTKGAFYAAGHRLAEDGTVDARHRLRPTHAAALDRVDGDPTLFCGMCGRRPGDSTDGSRPTPVLEALARRLAADVEHDLAPDALAAAVDAANDADTDDYHVLARALLAATPLPPKSDG